MFVCVLIVVLGYRRFSGENGGQNPTFFSFEFKIEVEVVRWMEQLEWEVIVLVVGLKERFEIEMMDMLVGLTGICSGSR